MINNVDINNGLIEAISKRKKNLWIFVCASILVIVGISLLMLKSKEKYALNLILSILLAIPYLLYLVFYFTVLRRRLLDEYRFYNGASNASLNDEKCQIIQYEDQSKISNGLEYFVLRVKVIGALSDTEKNYLVTNKFEFDKNAIYKVNLYGTVLISYEVAK